MKHGQDHDVVDSLVHWTCSKELSPSRERAWKKFWGKLLREDNKPADISDT